MRYTLLEITGSVMVSATSSLDASGNLNLRRMDARTMYDDLLLGQASRSLVGQEYVIDNPHARPPSWTQHHAGLNHSFVGAPFSSSMHEVYNLNARLSSSVDPFETTAVPASGALYYSKQERFVRRIFAVTASADLIVYPTSSYSPNSYDFGSGRSKYVAASGTFICHGWDEPAEIIIPVTERGRLVDLKVWIELVHDIRTREALSDGGNWQYLGGLTLGIASPNVDIGWRSVPRWGVSPEGISSLTSNRSMWYNTYLLWWGQFSAASSNGGDVSNRPGVFNFDCDLRTVFSDGSPNRFPDNLRAVYNDSDQAQQGVMITTLMSGFSPNHAYLTLYGPINSLTSSAYGLGFPWFADYRIKGNRPERSGSYSNWQTLVSGSPPPGWLTGPGGTNSAGEWPTTGSNLGPATIQPIFPMLDESKISFFSYDPSSIVNSDGSHEKVMRSVVFRPGLRGSEVNGNWKLKIATGRNLIFFTGSLEAAVWFRQVRLEMIIDKREPTTIDSRRFKKPGNVILKNLATIRSGSLSMIETVLINTPTDTYGRTIGITELTSSNINFAVFSRLTGSLSDYLTGSAHAHARYRYLNNEFGTPLVPISSGSVAAQIFEQDEFNNKEILANFFKTKMPSQSDIKNVIGDSYSIPSSQLITDLISDSSGSE